MTFKKIWNGIIHNSIIKAIVLVLLFILPVIVYYLKFHNYPISDNPSDWADFGSYIGGIYTVVVTIYAVYLTRHLENRDIEKKKSKEAIGTIFEQISIIDSNNVNLNMVKKLLRLINQNELYLSQNLYDRLVDLYDDYVVAKENPHKFSIQKLEEVKRLLKQYYDS